MPKRKPKGVFIYPRGGEWPSPHPCFVEWAKAVGVKKFIEVPKGYGSALPKGFDFIISESLYCAPTFAAYVRKNPRCKVIQIIADTTFLPSKLSFFRRMYYYLYFKYVDVFVFQSQRMLDDALAHFDLDRKTCVVLHSFALNKINAVKNKSRRNILFIGNAVPEKGSQQAVNAMKWLPCNTLIMVGSCGSPNGMLAPDGKNINVLTFGRVPSLKKYFNRCYYYLHPSEFDPCPSSVWEAMYAGLIPIITKDVGNSEVFGEALSRLVIPGNDSKIIADKIMELESLPASEHRKLRAASMKLAHEFTKEKSIKKFKQVFHGLL